MPPHAITDEITTLDVSFSPIVTDAVIAQKSGLKLNIKIPLEIAINFSPNNNKKLLENPMPPRNKHKNAALDGYLKILTWTPIKCQTTRLIGSCTIAIGTVMSKGVM